MAEQLPKLMTDTTLQILSPEKKMMIKKITLKTENTGTCHKVNSTISIAL